MSRLAGRAAVWSGPVQPSPPARRSDQHPLDRRPSGPRWKLPGGFRVNGRGPSRGAEAFFGSRPLCCARRQAHSRVAGVEDTPRRPVGSTMSRVHDFPCCMSLKGGSLGDLPSFVRRSRAFSARSRTWRWSHCCRNSSKNGVSCRRRFGRSDSRRFASAEQVQFRPSIDEGRRATRRVAPGVARTGRRRVERAARRMGSAR